MYVCMFVRMYVCLYVCAYECMCAPGNSTIASKLYSNSIMYYRGIVQTPHPDTIEYYGKVAKLMKIEGDLAGARVLFEQLLSMLHAHEDAHSGPHTYDTEATFSYLESILEAQRDTDGLRALQAQRKRLFPKSTGVPIPGHWMFF